MSDLYRAHMKFRAAMNANKEKDEAERVKLERESLARENAVMREALERYSGKCIWVDGVGDMFIADEALTTANAEREKREGK
jgi:hypothetical protein